MCHPGHKLDFKSKDLIGPDQTLLFSSQSKVRISLSKLCLINYFCTELTLFCTVYKKNCSALSQSKSSNFFMHVIRGITVHHANA